MSDENMGLLYWREFLEEEKTYLNRLFLCNAGGATAVLGFIGAQYTAGISPHGTTILFLFVLGICSCLLSMMFRLMEKISTVQYFFAFEKRLKQHSILFPPRQFVTQEYYGETDFDDKMKEQLRKAGFSEEGISKFNEVLSKLVRNKYGIVGVFRSLGFLCFIFGCLFGGISLVFA